MGVEFTKNTAITFSIGIANLVLSIVTSIVLARTLGPDGRGIYALAVLLPSLIETFGSLGIGPATVYYVARNEFPYRQILGNNIFLCLVVSALGVLAGTILVLFFRQKMFPGVAPEYLFMALVLVPFQIFFLYINYILLGLQKIWEFNYINISKSILFFGFVTFALLGLRFGVTGVLLAGILSWFVVDILLLHLTNNVTKGIDFKPNISYIKRVTTYGIQAHLANILGFLNYRLDLLLLNYFLGPAVVGLYAVGVGLVESLWMISSAVSTVLFPRVAAEINENRRNAFTPPVARIVLWTTTLGALVFLLLSRWIVLVLYSEKFLPAVSALQALLLGIVALSAGRVLANDIAGRGFQHLNIYSGTAAVFTNLILNILWIPSYGIVGAAWASTVSYIVSFLCFIYFYCHLSGNRWTVVVLPQEGDFAIYWKTARDLFKCYWAKVKTFISL